MTDTLITFDEQMKYTIGLCVSREQRGGLTEDLREWFEERGGAASCEECWGRV
ncbi:predicted protein [Botrytis cinerea T4]|uniref:Uncharacterized protein n=1 Tax=Botryotinia fuckeliana (strain T4) TaxID=999810 RepID=G2YEZ7_BOTF4|nr:predicted protein [Botrytis cinerea T4]